MRAPSPPSPLWSNATAWALDLSWESLSAKTSSVNNVVLPGQICSVASQNADLDGNGAAVFENTLGRGKGRGPNNTISGKLALDRNQLLTLRGVPGGIGDGIGASHQRGAGAGNYIRAGD